MLSQAISPTFRIPPPLRRRTPPSADLPAAPSGSSNLRSMGWGADVYNARWRCRALWKPTTTQEYSLGLIPTELPEKTHERDGERHNLLEIPGKKNVSQMVNQVKTMLSSMGDGEITISAYDTAWVALVPNIHGIDGPQFPSSLQWIVDHQLPDGSWGDDVIFNAHDRLLNTLACVIALKSWNKMPERSERGLEFLCENMRRLAEEDETLMPIGFEITFPSLIEIAKEMGLELPYDDPALQDVYAKRNLKLTKIPREVLHKVPTTLLHSLEGMPDLDWEKLLGLQFRDGSFLFSPSSTAYALMKTGDKNCLYYLQRIVDRFDGGVPNVYPVDLFEHLWAVDRLQRLGISRYFEKEIEDCMSYVYRYWSEDGICWARHSTVQDVDDTAMGFRLLRLHGYDVSPDVFKNFKKDEEFFCFAGQSNQAVTGMYNLNRASQVMFPGEEILESAMRFSYRFLRDKLASNQLLDKWIITKDLSGEVEYAMDFPLYASLPRVEARLYADQYGGGGDVWIGKTLYRMPRVNNDLFMDLAKDDFNRCQAVHQQEWIALQKWYKESNMVRHGVSQKSVEKAYFLAVACIFEPERAAERLGWARTAVVAEAVSAHFISESCTDERRRDFIRDFRNGRKRSGRNWTADDLLGPLMQLIDDLAAASDGHRHLLTHAWEQWLLTWRKEEIGERRRWSACEETGLLLVRTIEACGGRPDPTAHPAFARLAQLTASVCHRITSLQVNGENSRIIRYEEALNSEMQELLRSVLERSDGRSSSATKQTLLHVAKSYYYAAHCTPQTLDNHIAKVLFERVV